MKTLCDIVRNKDKFLFYLHYNLHTHTNTVPSATRFGGRPLSPGGNTPNKANYIHSNKNVIVISVYYVMKH